MANFSEEQNRLLDAIRKMEADGIPENKIRQVIEYAKQKNPSLVGGKAKQQPAFSLAPPPEPKMKGALGAIEAQGIEVPTKPSGETMPDIGKEESRFGFIGRGLKDLVTKEAPRGLGMAGSFIAPYGLSPAGQAARLEAAAEIEEVNKQRRQDYPKLSVKPATDVFSNPTDLDAWTAAASTIMPTAVAMFTAPFTGGGSAVALTGSYFGSSLANSYTEGVKSGLDDTQSMLYGTVMGSIEAAAENLGLNALTKIPKSWLSKTVKESVKKYGKEGAEKTLKESMKAITAWLAKRGIGAAQGAFVEGAEEGLTSLGQSGTQLAFDASTGSELFDPNKQVPQGGVVGEVFSRALEAGAGGAIGGGLIGGVRGIETRGDGVKSSSLDELEQARQKELEDAVPFLRWQRENAKQFNSNPRKGIVYYINAYENSLKQAKDERTKKEIEDEIRKAKLNLQAYDEINAKYNALKQNSTSPDAEIDETDLEALSEPPAPISEPPIDPTAPPVTDTAPLDPNTPEGAADIATEVLTQKADELDEDLAALSQLDEEVVTDEVDRVEKALQGYRETEEFDDEQLEAMRPFFQEIYNLDDELAAITSKEAKDSLGILKKKYSQRKKDIGKRRKEIDKAISDIAEGNFARASTAAVVEEDLAELVDSEDLPPVEMGATPAVEVAPVSPVTPVAPVISEATKQEAKSTAGNSVGQKVSYQGEIGVIIDEGGGKYAIETPTKIIEINSETPLVNQGVRIVGIEKRKPFSGSINVLNENKVLVNGDVYDIIKDNNGNTIYLQNENEVIQDEDALIQTDIQINRLDIKESYEELVNNVAASTNTSVDVVHNINQVMSANMTENVARLLDKGVNSKTTDGDFLSLELYIESTIKDLETMFGEVEYAKEQIETLREIQKILDNEYDKQESKREAKRKREERKNANSNKKADVSNTKKVGAKKERVVAQEKPTVPAVKTTPKEEPVKQTNKKDEKEPVLEGVQGRRDEGEGRKESPELRPQEAKQEEVEKSKDFTDGNDLQRIRDEVKAKYKPKEAERIIQTALRLVNPNKNKIVKIKSGGVFVEKGDKVLFYAFSNTDAHSSKWILINPLDVTDDFKPKQEKVAPPLSEQGKSDVGGSNTPTVSDATKETRSKLIKKGGYLFTNTPSLTDVEVEEIKIESPSLYEREVVFSSENKKTLKEGVEKINEEWYKVGNEFYNITKKIVVKLSHAKGGRDAIVNYDFIQNNITNKPSVNTPTVSDFEAISAKGEKGRKARAELTKRLGKDTVNDMTRITANFESIINNLENQGKIRKECP